MTPRPGFVSKRRPLSAIFLGDISSNPSPSNLPDLPEPPSPGAESSHSYASGLPSPPATNSTGSGGDKSADGGSVRRRSVSDTAADMSSSHRSASSGSRHSRASSPGDDDEGNEDDSTARLNQLRRRSSQTSSENAAALQRVLSLTQRNRMALDKLSRLNTPSPSGRRSRSPLPPLTGGPYASSSSASSSSSSSRQSSHAHTQSFPSTRDRDAGLSGSETEREGHLHSYSSDEFSSTPPSTISRSTDPRVRTTSMPNSPQRRRSRSRTSSPGPSSSQQRTPRKRVSLMSAPDADVTQAALAAVASMRRSPTLSAGRRSRQPLPKEFFDAKKGSSDGRISKEPPTPQKPSFRALANSPSPRHSALGARESPVQLSPHRGLPRSSTVRELARKHQMRWLSEDLDAPVNEDDDILAAGRRQARRAGSMETSLGARLVGDSLRAAGIGMRRDAGDDSPASIHPHRQQVSESDHSQEFGEDTSRAAPSRASSILLVPRTPAPTRDNRSRPATSMADFSDSAPRTAPPALRNYRSTYLERNREGIGSRSAARPSPQPPEQFPTPLRAPQFAERTYGSPKPRPREWTSTPNGKSGRPNSMADEQSIEHLKLVSEALTVFETQLSRLPLMGDTTTSTVPDLFKDAQSIVRSAEQVNSMLRLGTNRALERQIDAEVDDEVSGGSVDMVQLWQDVGSDFRDCLRSSDELVRTMANFLVGAGKVLREATAISNGPGMQQHLRAASLDSGAALVANVGDARSSTASGSGHSSARGSGLRDGRKSADSRRSWDALRGEVQRGPSRAENRSSLQLPERDRIINRTPDPEMAPSASTSSSSRPSLSSGIVPSSSMRRIYAPRESAGSQRDVSDAPEDRSFDYDDVDPSPTPAVRYQPPISAERLRGLPPLSIPRRTETPPASAQLGRRVTVPDRTVNRRKTSTTSNITVRAAPAFAVPPTPSATTALTPATASSNHTPDKMVFPVQRMPSDTSGSSKKSGVTFSRATASSERKRTVSATSPAEITDQHVYAATPVYGRTTPRDSDRPSSAIRTTLSKRTGVVGPRPRASLDSGREEERSTATQSRTVGSSRKERRRTITEIFSS